MVDVIGNYESACTATLGRTRALENSFVVAHYALLIFLVLLRHTAMTLAGLAAAAADRAKSKRSICTSLSSATSSY